MSENTHLTDAWLQSVRDAFKASNPVMSDLLKEHDTLVKWFTIFKYALELSPDSSSEQSKLMLVRLDQLLAYMTESLGVITSLHGLSMSVNAVMSEHEE